MNSAEIFVGLSSLPFGTLRKAQNTLSRITGYEHESDDDESSSSSSLEEVSARLGVKASGKGREKHAIEKRKHKHAYVHTLIYSTSSKYILFVQTYGDDLQEACTSYEDRNRGKTTRSSGPPLPLPRGRFFRQTFSIAIRLPLFHASRRAIHAQR